MTEKFPKLNQVALGALSGLASTVLLNIALTPPALAQVVSPKLDFATISEGSNPIKCTYPGSNSEFVQRRILPGNSQYGKVEYRCTSTIHPLLDKASLTPVDQRKVERTANDGSVRNKLDKE
jgi:hypothetical protein